MRNGLSRFWVVAGGLVLACGPAYSLGFGDTRAQVLLGQPLNLAVPVTLAEGESLPSECVGAEVQSGESRLPPGTVRARVTQGRDATEAVLRVVSSVPIDEPIVTLTLTAGCPTRITRTVVLLADPPLVLPTTAQPAPTAPAAAPVAQSPSPPATPTATPAEAPRAPVATAPRQRATRPAPPPRATARTAAPRSGAPATAVAPEGGRSAARAAVPAARKAEPPAAEGRPRLELDSPQLSLSAALAQAADAQASAAQARANEAEAAASAARQRMRDMEAELARIRDEAKAQTEALNALRLQIAQDQSQRQQQTWLVPVLLAATALLALTSLWLAWRARQQKPAPSREVWWEHGPASVAAPPREDDTGFRASTLQPSTGMPLPVPPAPPPLVREQRQAGAVGLDSLISPPTVASPVAVTIPPAPPMPREPEGLRAVSVDEQIDLEQQADFFIALGHDESAIDLLMAHLRSTGGGTPLPFLKLLEIHRRRGDREAYERTRVRFNQRFNSIAPDWISDPKAGRSLEEYPLVVGRIQHAWPTPLDAMAELEALLFRRGTGAELFDLPAYQELLFLYQLARDLHQSAQPEDAKDVDVLLPIGGPAPPVSEGTIVLRPEFNAGQEVKLDLDLTHEPGSPAQAKPDLEFDLGPDAPKSTGPAKDVWSEDPDDHRRE